MPDPFANGRQVPRFAIANRDRQQNNGVFIPNSAIYVKSGSLDNILGGSTGSVEMQFDTFGLRLRRAEVFHSGSAASFDVTIENSTPNTGSDYDPRSIVAIYDDLIGSDNFCSGLDKVDDLIALTDTGGKLYLKVRPSGTGLNSFKYLLFFEAVIIYTDINGQF